MESIIDLNEYQIREQADSAHAFLLVKPLTDQHIETIETTYKNHSNLCHWCGYAFIENIPASLENEILSISANETIGALLFLNTPELLHLLVQDVHNNFHLITESGQTISIKKTLGEILVTLRRRKNETATLDLA